MFLKAKRFLRYTITGGSTFAIDLCLLYLLTDIFKWNYLIAAALGFIIAVSLNYWLSRKYVFSETLRSVGEGYMIFIGIALCGIISITGFMYLFVAKLGWPYLISRIAIGSFTGLWNYFLNLYVNFRVVEHGKSID